MARYNNPAIKQLSEQQRKNYVPTEKKIEQIQAAESFLQEINPEETYRYQYIYQRLLNHKSQMYPDLIISGKDAIHDLRRFVEDLSDSADLNSEQMGEPVLTVEDVSKRYNVSTKTVDRWRDRGLVSRKLLFGKRKRIGFLESAVERFVDAHEDEVQRGTNFSQLSDDEREDIVRKARRMARQGGCPSDVSRQLAGDLGRSPETIRYTLKHYDEEHPESAVFPNATRPLTEEFKREIYRSYRRGVPVDRLAEQHCRTKASIYRIVTEVRAQQLAEQPIEFMHSDDFQRPDAEGAILGPVPERDRQSSRVKAPPGLPPYLSSLYAIPLLNREQEQYYFRKMNYLKFKAASLQEALNPTRPKAKEMDEIEHLLEESLEIKNFLIRSNLRLVVSIAKKHINPANNFFEMVSDGNMSLIRAIEKFDYTKGNKFSTYASWAIMKNFARSIPAEHKQLDRFRTGNEELFMQSQDGKSDMYHEELVNQKQHQAIMSILNELDQREREIIVCRFGLDQQQEPQTLEQVGVLFGVTKERIRQLEARAIKKLRKIAAEKNLEIPGI